MKIRPRLLVVSLLVAVAVIGMVVWIQSSGDDDAPVDATLEDSQSVITFPDDGLTNQDVQGDSLPDAVMSDTDGNEVTTADLIGEPLVVNLWNSTCPPCARELPDFAEVDAETDEVRFIGINFLDSIEVMERFAGERGVEYDLLFDEFAEFTDAIGANALPITLFVTSDGTIIQQTGALDADELRAEIANLLAIDEASA